MNIYHNFKEKKARKSQTYLNLSVVQLNILFVGFLLGTSSWFFFVEFVWFLRPPIAGREIFQYGRVHREARKQTFQSAKTK